MLWLFKTLSGLAIFAALLYAAFFVRVGEKPLAQHALDVWHSKAVQQKVTKVKDNITAEIERKLAEAASAESTSGDSGTAAPQHISEDDRKALEALLSRKQQSASSADE